MEKKLSEYEFVVRAIKKLRKPPYKGIHSVYSGFNQAFKDYFGTNPVETTQKLAQEGKITIRPVKGGVMLYLPEEAPGQTDSKKFCKRFWGEINNLRLVWKFIYIGCRGCPSTVDDLIVIPAGLNANSWPCSSLGVR